MRTAFLPGTPLKGHTAGCSISLLLQVHEQSRVGAAFAIELFLSWGLAWVCSDPAVLQGLAMNVSSLLFLDTREP